MTDHKDYTSLADKIKSESDTTSVSPIPWKEKIHKVNPSLRTVNKKEYEPFLLSIGPYHHGRENLQDMEKYKVRMLRSLLDRTKDKVENYIAAMREIEEEARRYYSSDIGMDRDKFIDMMILDGCFILEFVEKMWGSTDCATSDFDMCFLLPDIFRDLMLFENQLPLFVLTKLFGLSHLTKDEEDNLEQPFADFINVLVLHFCFHYMGGKTGKMPTVNKNSPHLLHLIYKTCSVVAHGVDVSKVDNTIEGGDEPTREEAYEIHVSKVDITIERRGDERDFPFIKSATTLEETGVKFKKAEQEAKLCQITFEKGVLKIPHLMITDRTECVFRNLVAYEQYIGEYDFTDYLAFMDYLINSPKDVELLRHSGIIANMLGDDEYVSIMFNKICAFVLVKISTPKFKKLCGDIKMYSEKSIHVWIAKLWREYFNSPWTLISFLAALLLLGLTIVQTVFSVISYTNPK